MMSEKFERALARERCGLRVPRRALIAVETVARSLVHLQAGRRAEAGAHPLQLRERNARVQRAVVEEHRTAGLVHQVVRDLAVVDDRTGEGQLAGGEVGERSAPAIADGRRAAGVPHDRNRRSDIAQCDLRGELGAVTGAFLEVGLAVAELDAAAHPVEEARGDRRVALGGEAVGYGADVAVHAEDLLQHDHRAARPPGRRGEPSLELMAVAGHEGGILAHLLVMASPDLPWHSNASRLSEASCWSVPRSGASLSSVACAFPSPAPTRS